MCGFADLRLRADGRFGCRFCTFVAHEYFAEMLSVVNPEAARELLERAKGDSNA
jgi:hypothetical protein